MKHVAGNQWELTAAEETARIEQSAKQAGMTVTAYEQFVNDEAAAWKQPITKAEGQATTIEVSEEDI
jgi:hypothetical protein